jgi:diaminohydroxyphosphoribosylaminopyrimidine deaminase/5-amino-6-(5-phosphoribosylamino)uracil reductase
MQLAIDKAWKYQLQTYPNPAVGATVVRENKVLSVEAHKEAGKPHAEVLALKEAYLTKYKESLIKDMEDSKDIHNYLYENHNDFFKDCEIYVTLEPCNHMGKTPACAMLLEKINIKKVYIGTLDPNLKASGGLDRLRKKGIEVVTNFCKKQTDELLYPFIKWQNGNFVFFKIAMREDGSIDGGYITTKDSLTLVHKIRTKIDLMLIGGNTVRIDKPTLDARFANKNNAPDIFILSNKKRFDKNIPLFNVKDREVFIGDRLDILNKRNFVMCEGGYSLLKAIEEKCDYLVVFLSHKKHFNNKFELNSLGFDKVYSYKINEIDEIIFLKKIED